jgi:hypothetical protein
MMEHDIYVDKLTEILLRNKVITREEALSYREQFEGAGHDNFDEFLLDEGLVTKEDMLDALSAYYEVPAIDVTGYFFDHELISNFPQEFLLRNQVIPLELDGLVLVVVAADPDDTTLLPKIGRFSPNDIEFQVGLARDITDAINEYYDKAVTEVDEDEDLDEERREREQFEEQVESED